MYPAIFSHISQRLSPFLSFPPYVSGKATSLLALTDQSCDLSHGFLIVTLSSGITKGM
jgi:hypothetical protein